MESNTKKLFIKTIFIFASIELASSIASIVDGLVVERFIGETALQAIGLTWPYISFVKLICNIVMAGAVLLCSDEIGKGNRREASSIFSTAIAFILIVSLPAMVIVLIFAPQLAVLLGATVPALMDSTAAYLRSMALGMIPNIFTLFLMPFMQMDNDRRRVPVSIIISTSVNITLNIVNTLVFHMGIFGIGLSTSVGFLCSAIYLMLHFRKKDCILRIRFNGLNRSVILKVLDLGKINGANRILSLLRNTMINKIIIVYGGLAAFTAHSAFTVFKMSIASVTLGMGSAGMLLVSLLYAEFSKKEIVKLWRFAVFFSCTVLVAITIIVILLSGPVFTAYLKNESPDETIRLVRIFALGLPLIGMRQLYMYHHVAVRNQVTAFWANFFGEFLITTLLCYVLGRCWGVVGMWAAYPISEAVFMLMVITIAFLKKKKGSSFADEFLGLKSISVEIRDEDSISVSSVKEIDRVHDWLKEFCHRNHVNNKLYCKIMINLESALLIASQQSTPSLTKARHDIRIIILGDNTLVIRLRNNCKAQQLLTKEQLELLEDRTSELELLLMYGISEDVKCITSMNLNNLIIKLKMEE